VCGKKAVDMLLFILFIIIYGNAKWDHFFGAKHINVGFAHMSHMSHILFISHKQIMINNRTVQQRHGKFLFPNDFSTCDTHNTDKK